MSTTMHALSQLASLLRGRRLMRIYRMPSIPTGELSGCRAFVEFDDGSRVELLLADVDDLVEYPVKELPAGSHELLEEVDGFSLRNLEVSGLCVAEVFFSFGIILNATPPMVLCLDTVAAVKLDLYVYPLHSLLLDGLSVFVLKDINGESVQDTTA